MATFTNQATLSYNNTVTNSNVVTGQLLEVLSATKTALTNDYTANGDVTFVVSILNSGTAPYTGLTVTDNLGAYTFNGTDVYPLTYQPGSLLYYVNGVLQPTPAVDATNPPLAITGLTVPAGGSGVLIYETQANAFAPFGPGASITNDATITGGGLSTPVSATATLSPTAGPVLAVAKSVSPVPVAENGRLTYTFTITNTGGAAAGAADNVTISDLFSPILEDITVAFNGTAWTETTNYTYDETTGQFTSVPGQILVPAATFTQDPTTGAWVATPGVSVLTITGTV